MRENQTTRATCRVCRAKWWHQSQKRSDRELHFPAFRKLIIPTPSRVLPSYVSRHSPTATKGFGQRAILWQDPDHVEFQQLPVEKNTRRLCGGPLAKARILRRVSSACLKSALFCSGTPCSGGTCTPTRCKHTQRTQGVGRSKYQVCLQKFMCGNHHAARYELEEVCPYQRAAAPHPREQPRSHGKKVWLLQPFYHTPRLFPGGCGTNRPPFSGFPASFSPKRS